MYNKDNQKSTMGSADQFLQAHEKWTHDKTFQADFKKDPINCLETQCGIRLNDDERKALKQLNLSNIKTSQELKERTSTARLGSPLRNFLLSLF